MKLNKLVFSVREALKEYSDDSELSDRFIIFLLDIKRAILISQKLNSFTTKFPRNATQTLCVEIEETNRYRCGIDIACDSLRRSVSPIPKLFDTVTGTSLLAVNSMDIIGKPFSKIDAKLVPYIEYSTYNDKLFTFLDDDNYLYVYSSSNAHKFLDCVQVQGVFETPQDLQEFKNCCGCSDEENTSCFTMETEYPIPAEMVAIIKDLVVDDIVKLRNLKEDRENDSEDNR